MTCTNPEYCAKVMQTYFGEFSTIISDDKRNSVCNDFSTIFLESYCLSDNDISLHPAKFERNYAALHDSSSEISWHSVIGQAKFHGT